MYKPIVAIFLISLPLRGIAEVPDGAATSPTSDNATSSDPVTRTIATPAQSVSFAPGFQPWQHSRVTTVDAAEQQSDAATICLRATEQFERQEIAKGNSSIVPGSLSASCRDQEKPAPYWACMEKRANERIDFNVAHWQCAKETKLPS